MFNTWSTFSKTVLILVMLNVLGIMLCVYVVFGVNRGSFHNEFALAVDPSGNIYASGANCVVKFSPDLQSINNWGDCDSGSYLAPKRLAITQQGVFYGLAYYTHGPDGIKLPPGIQKLDSNGKVITSWGGQGSEDGQLNGPYNIAVDPAGMVYVMDQGDSEGRIQEFDGDGRFVAKWLSQDNA